MFVDMIKLFLPAILIIAGISIVLLSIYAQKMRNRYDKITDHENLYVGECPHVNSYGSPIRRQGMVADPKTGELSAHSQSSQSLIKAVS